LIDHFSDIRRLPIFPLPIVMLPNELVPLHIFEERYRQMVLDIEAERNRFGLTYFESSEPFIDRPPVGSIGCVAEIREAEKLPDGRSNILTLGVVRFRLRAYLVVKEPYLVAEVEPFNDDIETGVEVLADEVFALFERMAKAAFELGGNRGPFPEIQRTDPESLSFLITAAFNFENPKKYRLLEMTSTRERLAELRGTLVQAASDMEASAEIQKVARSNGHSSRKPNI
jgi:Lon protease-like protein